VISDQRLVIEPDHELAPRYYDLLGLSNVLIEKQLVAIRADDIEELKRQDIAMSLIVAEQKKIEDEIRRERGADETCRVVLTYDEHGLPVVKGRFQLLPGGKI
jgi:hypothetical protein